MTNYTKVSKTTDENAKGNYVPLSIQSFLLTQTDSFFFNKGTRDNACISLERVLVQNIIHGLSPTICSAIQMVSRWQLIKTAFPHVMHCASLLMREKFGLETNKSPFSLTETKIMYTLHWIIMDAASECEDNDRENKCSDGINYLHDISTIQLFVYLFAPLINLVDESFFQTLKLENGLTIWTPLRNHQQPDLSCFTALVKPKGRKSESLLKPTEAIGAKSAQIYIGKGSSVEKLTMDPKDRTSFVNGAFCPANILYPEESIDSEMTTSFGGTSLLESNPKSHWIRSAICGGDNVLNNVMTAATTTINPSILSPAPLARLSDICPLSTVSGDTLNLEIFCDNCNSVVSNKSGELIGCSCHPLNVGPHVNKRNSWSLLHPRLGKLNFPIDWDYKNKIINETAACTKQAPVQGDDFLLATHLDVAVLRCLFCPKWSEAGVHWGLSYLHKRLLEISNELRTSEEQEKRLQNSFKRRSKSTTCLKTEIPESFWHEPIGKRLDLDSNPNQHPIDDYCLESCSRTLISQDPTCDLSASFPSSVWDRSMSISTMGIRPSKKIKMTDFKERFTKMSKLKKPDMEKEEENAETGSTYKSQSANQMLPIVFNHGMKLPSSPRQQQRSAKVQDETVIPEELIDSGSDKDERRSSLPSEKFGLKMSPIYTEAEALIPPKKSRKTVTHKNQSNGLRFKPITSRLRTSRFVDVVGGHENPIVQPEIQVNGEINIKTPPAQPPFVLPDDPATALDPLPDFPLEHDFLTEDIKGSQATNEVYPTPGRKTTSFFDDSPKQEKTYSYAPPPSPVPPLSTGPSSYQTPQIQYGYEYNSRKPLLHRSPSDTEINYQLIEDLEEVPGCVHYIQQNGQMNYNVILKALQSQINNNCQSTSIRVCENIMNNMACLFDIGVFEKRPKKEKPISAELDNSNNSASTTTGRRSHQTQSKHRRGRSNNGQSPLVPPRIEAQRSSLGSSLQQLGGTGNRDGVGRRDRRVSMMISHSSYQAMKDWCGPSQSDEDASDESRSKLVPAAAPTVPLTAPASVILPNRPNKIDKTLTTKKAKDTLPEDCNYGTMSNNDIAMEIIIKVIKVLGCCHEHLCQNQSREKRSLPQGTDPSKTRLQTHECLLKLYKMHGRKFQHYLRKMAQDQPLQDIVEFLHAFTGFCNDPVVIRPVTGQNARNSYKNSFNQSVTGEGTRGSEGILIANILEPLVERLITSRKDLICQENFVLYSDLRQLLHYFKEIHGSTFRRVMLTGLLRVWRKHKRTKSNRNGARQLLSSTTDSHLLRSGHSLPFDTEFLVGRSSSDVHNRASSLSAALMASELLQHMSGNSQCYKAGKKNIFKRYSSAVHNSTSDSNSLPIHVPIYRRGKIRESLCSSQTAYHIANDVKDIDDIVGNEVTDSTTILVPTSDCRSRRTRSLMCNQDHQIQGQDHQTAAPLTSSTSPLKSCSVNNDIDDEDELEFSVMIDCSGTGGIPSPNQNLSATGGASSAGGSKYRGKILTKPPKDVGRDGGSETSPSASINTIPKSKNRKFIDPFLLKRGMSIFSFMLDIFEPGMLPEAQLVASMLDLEAPVLARACLLMELANFVTRCNKGEWPSWMRFTFPGSYRHSSTVPMTGNHHHYPSSGVSICGPAAALKQNFPTTHLFANSASRRTNHFQRQAGQMFHGWAEALGTRLEYFLKIEQAADRFANISEIQDETKMRELQISDEEENFLDDSTVNSNGDSCPYALKSVVVQLLLAITTYLRESHQYLPKYRMPSSGHKEPFYDRSFYGHVDDHKRAGQNDFPATSAATATATVAATTIPYNTRANLSAQGVELHSPISDDQDSMESIVGEIGQINTVEVHQPVAANRRISFAFIQERSASLHSSNNSLDQTDGGGSKERKANRYGAMEGGSSYPIFHHQPTVPPPVPAISATASFLSPIRKISETLERRKSIGGKNLLRKRRGSGSFQRTNTVTTRIIKPETVGSLRNSALNSSSSSATGVGGGGSHTRMGSIRCRKESSQSQISGVYNFENALAKDHSSGSEDVSINYYQPSTMARQIDHDNYSSHMPWLRVVTQLANKTNFVCNHVDFCHPDCYERQQRQCRRLLNAIKTVYSCDLSRRKRDRKNSVAAGHRDCVDNGDLTENSEEDGPHSASLGGSLAAALSHSVGERGSCDTDIDASMQLLLHRAVSESDEKKLSLFARSKRKESMFGNHSPHRRKDSVPLFDKFLKYRSTAISNSDELGLSINIGERGEPASHRQRFSVKEKPVDHAILRYLENHVFNLTHNCFNIVNKGALLFTENMLTDIMPVAWELLLENDPELVASASNVIILAAIKIPILAQQLIFRELQHEDVNQRMSALLRFRSLWCCRFQFWQRLEENASNQLKIPPPYIEFVLPSPTLGHPGSDVPDPSWSIRKGQSAEEVQLKQNEAAKTFVTASTTRRKQQQEMLERAVNAEEQRRKSARQEFHLTTCSILEKASYEIAFSKEHKDELSLEDDEDNGSCLTVPVLSNQPLQYAQCVFPSSLCAASIPIIHLLDDSDVNSDGVAVSTIAEHVIWECLVEDTTLFLRYVLERLTRVAEKDELLYVLRKLIQRLPELPTQSAHALFNNLVGYIMFYVRTPSISAPESIAGALSFLWQIVPFVQNIYFKDLKQILRKEQVDPTLMVTANLPCAKQFNVFDEDVFVAQLVRLQDETKDYRFAEILKEALQDSNIPERDHHLYTLCDDRSNIIRNSSHYVRDFYSFKRNHTPKLRLKKMTLDDGINLLQKNAFNLKFLEIGKVMFSYSILKYTPPNQINNHVYFLHDELTKHPSFPRKALESEFSLYENGSLGKQLYGMDMLHKISWCRLVSLLFERMPSSFPWTSDIHLFLNIFNGVLILHAEDTAMLRMCIAGYIQASQHFKMIFSVNGYLAIMPTILRVYSKNLHNIVLKKAIHFMCKQFYILHRTPFILQMFGSISNFIDFQGDEANFYKVKPFIIYDILRAISTDLEDSLNILQLLSCSKPLKALDFCYENENDSWSVLEAVTLCVTVIVYNPDSSRAKQMMIILQAILPLILRDLHKICLPTETHTNTENSRKIEAQAIQQLAVSIKQLICTCDYLTRQSDKPFGKSGDEKCSFKVGGTYSQTQNSVALDDQDESPYRLLEEGRFRKNTVVSNICDEPSGVNSARHAVNAIAPHEAILQVSCDFYTSCHNRLSKMGEKHKALELLDQKSIMRLSELAQSIIKQIPNDINLLRSKALKRFFLEIPPFVDWDHESMKSCKALENLIYRLNRTMNKILKDSISRRNLDWDSMTTLIKAVFLIVKRNKSVAFMKDVRQLMDYLKKLILLDSSLYAMNESLSSVQFSGRHEQTSPNHIAGQGAENAYLAPHSNNIIPAKFSSMVVKFFALMLQSLESTYKLKDFCERFDQRFGNTEAILINYMENIIIPLLLRCGGGRKDSIQMSDDNIYFIFDIILSSLNPIIHSGYQASRVPVHPTVSNQIGSTVTSKGYLGTGTQGSTRFLTTNIPQINTATSEYPAGLTSLVGLTSYTNKTQYQHLHAGDSNQIRSSSVSHSEKSVKYGNDYLYRLSFLALKVAMICYPRHTLIQTRSISAVISDLGFKKQGGIHLWKFLDFIVSKRTPIFLSLIPFLRFKASQIKCDTQGEQAFQQVINQKFIGLHLPSPKSEATILKELALDLRQIKDELMGYYSQAQCQSLVVTVDPNVNKASIRNIIPSFTNDSLTNSSICNQSAQGSVGFSNVKDNGRTTYLVRTAITRNSNRRISAKEGGNIICRYQQVQNPLRSDAILTVSSVDSLPSQATLDEDAPPVKKFSGRLTRGETRNKKSMKLHWKQRPGSMVAGKSSSLASEKQQAKQSMISGMATPVGSAVAAAQAAQLYGSAAPYLRESLTRSRPEELIEMKGVPSFPMDETESNISEASLLKRSHNMYRSKSEETEETNISPRDSLIPSLDNRHKVIIIESTYSTDKGNSEEALLSACGAGATLAESESSNASVTEYSSLIKLKPPKESF